MSKTTYRIHTPIGLAPLLIMAGVFMIIAYGAMALEEFVYALGHNLETTLALAYSVESYPNLHDSAHLIVIAALCGPFFLLTITILCAALVYERRRPYVLIHERSLACIAGWVEKHQTITVEPSIEPIVSSHL